MKKTIAVASTVVLAAALSTTNNQVSTDWILPNSKVTPGSINPDVTQANIQSTICTSGFTATIRPSVSYTNKIKQQEISVGGAYYSESVVFGNDLGNYELDHLISLELGGNPTDVKNLWMQPYDGNNAHKKDALETTLKRLVCAGNITLRNAQKAIAKNWVKAYNEYVGLTSINNN